MVHSFYANSPQAANALNANLSADHYRNNFLHGIAAILFGLMLCLHSPSFLQTKKAQSQVATLGASDRQRLSFNKHYFTVTGQTCQMLLTGIIPFFRYWSILDNVNHRSKHPIPQP